MKRLIEELLRRALIDLPGELLSDESRRADVEIERARDPRNGDFASSIALKLAKAARQNPRALAQALVSAIPADESIAKIEIAGPGFINFFLSEHAYETSLGQVLDSGERYGTSDMGAGRSVLVEFVSANPTGPLHVGHGRHAAYGASVANLLQAVGHRVAREYYINDAGRQMEILAASTWLRYLELCGERFDFPANGYRGEYIVAIAADIRKDEGERLRREAGEVFLDLPKDAPLGDKDLYIDALIVRARRLLGEADFNRVLTRALGCILLDIREDLAEFGVHFDSWYSERSLSASGAVDRALAALESSGDAYRKDGALWFKSTAYGDEKDRVMVRENGIKTYFSSDLAFVLDKLERGFAHLLYIWGADHHGYIVRLRAGMSALGRSPENFEVRLVQFVSLFQGGEKAQMSTRSGEFVTLRELRAEVGNDAARLFYVMRSNDQHLDFDLELAKSRSNENPVYYIQYAHARISSVRRQLAERGIAYDDARGRAALAALVEPHERQLMRRIVAYPETVQQAAMQRAPHTIVQYLRDLATDFHSYYTAHQFIVAESQVRDARLCLAFAAQIVIRNGLALLGVSAPDTM